MDINILLFEKFETLDAFGPVEVLGHLKDYELHYYTQNGGIVTSAQNTPIMTQCINDARKDGILVIPGGMGTRLLVNDTLFINMLKDIVEQSSYCLSICTGSALLAKTGLLDGRRATSNKNAFEWVKSINTDVNWVRKARWIADGKYYTSSGVSAGIDMTLGFIRDCFQEEKAIEIANHIEYLWNSDDNIDLFV